MRRNTAVRPAKKKLLLTPAIFSHPAFELKLPKDNLIINIINTFSQVKNEYFPQLSRIQLHQRR